MIDDTRRQWRRLSRSPDPIDGILNVPRLLHSDQPFLEGLGSYIPNDLRKDIYPKHAGRNPEGHNLFQWFRLAEQIKHLFQDVMLPGGEGKKPQLINKFLGIWR
jgi:hypothetical protein